MPDTFYGGDTAYVKLGAASYSFNNWELPIDGGTKKFFAFGSNYQRTTAGGISGEVVCTGPYNVGNMPLVVNTIYELHLGHAPGVEHVVSARLANIKLSSTIDQGGDPDTIACTFFSDGAFTASVS